MQFQLVAVVVTDAWKMSGGVCQIEKAIVGLTELRAGQRASNNNDKYLSIVEKTAP
jgi:hypothetical protein